MKSNLKQKKIKELGTMNFVFDWTNVGIFSLIARVN